MATPAQITVSVNVPQLPATPATTPAIPVNPGIPPGELPRTGLGAVGELLLVALALVCLGLVILRAIRPAVPERKFHA